jgi:hypothetical protein
MTKRPHLLILAALFASALAAQPADTEPATLFGSDKDYRNGGWGGPMVAFTEVLDQPALLTGLRGGWMIDHRFTLGLAGYGLVTNAPNPAYDQWLLEEGESLRHPSQFRMGYGGLLLEPVIGYKSPIHVTLPILIGAGGCTYQTYLPRPFRDSTHRVDRFERGEAFFVVEPGVELELSLVRLVRVAVGASYRYTTDIDLPATPADALRGMNATFTVKVGRF